MADTPLILREDPCAPSNTTPFRFVRKFTDSDGREVLELMGQWRWDVSIAKELASEKSVVRQLDVRSFRSWLAQSPHMVDRANALGREIDRTAPLIGIPFRLGGEELLIILDGWNRMWRAYRLGRHEYPAILLSEEEEKYIRLGGDWSALDR